MLAGKRDGQIVADNASADSPKTFCRGAAFLIAKNEIHFRHFLEDKIWQGRFVGIVRSGHLNSQSDSLVVFLRQFKNQLHVVGQLQAPGPRLHFSPRRADVNLLA